MRDSFLVNGVAFKKTFSYAGFEQQPKKFDNPKILLLNLELELKSEKENAEVRYRISLLLTPIVCYLCGWTCTFKLLQLFGAYAVQYRRYQKLWHSDFLSVSALLSFTVNLLFSEFL